MDIAFLSGHLWPDMNRAAGTFMDAYVFGMMAARWGPACIGLTVGRTGARPMLLGAAGLGLAFVGVWASGSRTALLP